jgi:hypothetical protein
MAFLQSSHAYASISKPEAWFFCDRCGFRKMHKDGAFQFDWRGTKLADLRILVCKPCLDDAQEQLRTIIIGPDPIPVRYPRPGFQASQQGFTPVFSVLEIVDGDILPPPPNVNDLRDDGGVLYLSKPAAWPSSAIFPGQLYSDGGACAVVLPTTPNPLSPPLVFGTPGITASYLLELGGANIPTSDPGMVGEIWNNNGLLCVSFGYNTFVNDGGVLMLAAVVSGWPTSPGPPGTLYSNGGVVSISPGFVATPGSPVFFGQITASQFLTIGGRQLPVTPPPSGSGRFWNGYGGNEVWVA